MDRRAPLAIFGVVLAASALCAAAAAPRAHRDAARIVLRVASLLDPESGTVRRDVVVIVAGERIAGVIPAADYRAQSDDQLIDLAEQTLMPGLIDAHVHLSIGGIAASANASLNAGFTTVADLGARGHVVSAVGDSIAARLRAGPRVLTAGMWIGVQNGVCEFSGIGIAGGETAFRERVRQNIARGADIIKLCITGWPQVAFTHPDSAELSPAIIAAVVDEAHRGGRKVVAHALSREGVRRALDAGVDGLVHAAYLDDTLTRRMRERGVWLVPTLASLTGGDTSVVSNGLIAGVRRAHAAGVLLVYGTDGGVLPHGQNATEAVHLQSAGISAADILRAATVNAARALGIADSVGAINPGMSADLVAFRGDPLADITVLQRPTFVMARGRVIRRPQ